MGNEIDILKDTLARACRVLERAGIIDYAGHISARLPGSQTFYIHPQELARTEVRPEDMAEVKLDGEWVGGKKNPPSETPIHAAVYQAREDVNSVIHGHPHYSILPSIAGLDLVPVCVRGSIFGAVVPVFGDAEKIAEFGKAHRLAQALGKERAIIMKGHGIVIAEASVEAAVAASLRLEDNARYFVEARMLGKVIPLTEEERLRACKSGYKPSSIRKAWSYLLEKGRKEGLFWD